MDHIYTQGFQISQLLTIPPAKSAMNPTPFALKVFFVSQLLVMCVEAIIYLLLYNLHDCTFDAKLQLKKKSNLSFCRLIQFS